MQPLRTKKNPAIARDKKITPPIGQKNYATSWDKKFTQPLGTKKNYAILGTKRIMQPLGTKKITQPFRTKKNHTTFKDITVRKNIKLGKNIDQLGHGHSHGHEPLVLFLFFLTKVLKLVGGGSVINRPTPSSLSYS